MSIYGAGKTETNAFDGREDGEYSGAFLWRYLKYL